MYNIIYYIYKTYKFVITLILLLEFNMSHINIKNIKINTIIPYDKIPE